MPGFNHGHIFQLTVNHCHPEFDVVRGLHATIIAYFYIHRYQARRVLMEIVEHDYILCHGRISRRERILVVDTSACSILHVLTL